MSAVQVRNEKAKSNGFLCYVDHPELCESRYEAQVWRSIFHDVVLTTEQFVLLDMLERWLADHPTVNLAHCAHHNNVALSEVKVVLNSCTQEATVHSTQEALVGNKKMVLKDAILQAYGIRR